MIWKLYAQSNKQTRLAELEESTCMTTAAWNYLQFTGDWCSIQLSYTEAYRYHPKIRKYEIRKSENLKIRDPKIRVVFSAVACGVLVWNHVEFSKWRQILTVLIATAAATKLSWTTRFVCAIYNILTINNTNVSKLLTDEWLSFILKRL